MSEQKILVPNIGDFKEVEVIEILVKEGQEIKKNDSVITLESDKSSVEVPSNYSGKIKKINIKVGDKVSEGSTILLIEKIEAEQTENITAPEGRKNSEIINFPTNEKLKSLTSSSSPAENKLKSASPNIRKFIRELGADVTEITGSERAGRIDRGRGRQGSKRAQWRAQTQEENQRCT
jgi:pyruvate dehydrogenase E2 component (dihydrolipoamide acetyltransferase)